VIPTATIPAVTKLKYVDSVCRSVSLLLSSVAVCDASFEGY
jgi:hypothetical protein